MIPVTRIPRVRSVPSLFIFLLLAGCSGDPTPLGPARPGGAAGEPAMEREPSIFLPMEPAGSRRATLENIWPNDDGRFWAYRIEQHSWNPPGIRYYRTSAEVPPLPRLDAIAELLRRRATGRNPVTETARYAMQFQGMRTTRSGATGQNLMTTILGPPGAIPGAALASQSIVTSGPEGGFLAALRVARPDLAPKLAARRQQTLGAPAIAQEVNMPTFLFGYAWVKTREYIGSYGDLNTELAWKYLEADLVPGHTFHMQLVPDLAQDVFLHARVLREGPSFSSVGSVRNGIDVLYVVDFGVSAITDLDGNVLGYSRMYSFGTITYAPFIGPIASYERSLLQTGPAIGSGLYDLSIYLTATGRGLPN
jgi:hypothetical protein